MESLVFREDVREGCGAIRCKLNLLGRRDHDTLLPVFCEEADSHGHVGTHVKHRDLHVIRVEFTRVRIVRALPAQRPLWLMRQRTLIDSVKLLIRRSLRMPLLSRSFKNRRRAYLVPCSPHALPRHAPCRRQRRDRVYSRCWRGRVTRLVWKDDRSVIRGRQGGGIQISPAPVPRSAGFP